MLPRRGFLALPLVAAPAAAAPRPNLGSIPRRELRRPEKVFDTPGPQPNGLQATGEGLWIIDQGNNRAYLLEYESGKVLREFATEADRASGITHDGEALWLASTYSRELIRCDARTGKTLERHFTPGAGVIYKRVGDAVARRSPLAKPPQPRAAQAAQAQPAKPNTVGTGAHGLEWDDGKLWVAVPPSRTVYRIDPATWVVEHSFPTAGNRPHGIGWEGRSLWVTDSNLNAFFCHNVDSGAIEEMIQLADEDPLPHGMSMWGGVLWYCDDVGIVCRMDL